MIPTQKTVWITTLLSRAFHKRILLTYLQRHLGGDLMGNPEICVMIFNPVTFSERTELPKVAFAFSFIVFYTYKRSPGVTLHLCLRDRIPPLVNKIIGLQSVIQMTEQKYFRVHFVGF